LDIPHYTLKRLANHKTTSDVTSGYLIVEVERLRGPMQMIAGYLKQHLGMIQQPESKSVPKTKETKRLTSFNQGQSNILSDL